MITRRRILTNNNKIIVPSTSGVYAYYADGSFRDEHEADSDAIGVAVIDTGHPNNGFIVGKTSTTATFGGYNKDLDNIGVLVSDYYPYDFAGVENTTNIINSLQGYNDGSSIGAPAAEWCRRQFEGKGYLPSVSEMNMLLSYYEDVEYIMEKIEGEDFSIINRDHWTSSLYDATEYAWSVSMTNGSSPCLRNTSLDVQCFRSLYD